ncbi:hypothetical protein ES319_D10G031100v1 [Gossypium barbadense]|uniref:Tropomyosin n=2 Tax=Gossypium TaxID=3633 RepID=A0A5J5PNI8_GOSBA|nr:hypothetical protein ES319_D10G031100v1 [Gossypium barbadense]TYH47930.1 hypothetical protein ES332_D10G032800v1 [Gossypium tomentosum]
MAAPLFPAIFTGFFFFVFFISLTSQDQLNNNDHNLLIRELDDAKLKLSRLESVLEETIQSIDAKTLLLKEREKLLEGMENKITYLQSVISTLKDDSLLADEKLKALEEEVRLLWDASRKNNFELHVMESEAQDTEDRVEAVNLKVEKMAEVVTEQWIQIQHLEQALQLAQRRALQDQRQRYMRCSFLKMLGALEYYSFGKGSTIKYYMSQALQQLRRFYSAIKKYHHQLQGFIKQEMRRNEFTAAFVNDELVFFLASALITFPVLGAWMVLSSQFS